MINVKYKVCSTIRYLDVFIIVRLFKLWPKIYIAIFEDILLED